VGDFIEASVAKGMVEHIFLRSPGLCNVFGKIILA
jgi:hypothetical protein